MNMNNKLIIVAASAFLSLVAASQATVITFEDLTGSNLLPANYHGLSWTDWAYYDTPQPPFNPSSGVERIYNFPDRDNTNLIGFNQMVTFTQLWLAGFSFGQYIIGYVGGVPVFQSTPEANDASPFGHFINVNWNVDAISIYSGNGDSYIVDDLTYQTSSVPDGGSTVSLLGFALLGVAVLRRKLRC